MHTNSLNSKVTKKDSTDGVEESQSTVAEEKKSVSIKEDRRQMAKRAEENLKLLAKATKADRGHDQAIERSQFEKAHGGELGLQVRLNISSVDAPQAKKVFVLKRTDGIAKVHQPNAIRPLYHKCLTNTHPSRRILCSSSYRQKESSV